MNTTTNDLLQQILDELKKLTADRETIISVKLDSEPVAAKLKTVSQNSKARGNTRREQ